jgi:hypothetical protein
MRERCVTPMRGQLKVATDDMLLWQPCQPCDAVCSANLGCYGGRKRFDLRSKSGVAHLLPLSPAAVKEFEHLERIAARAANVKSRVK